MSTAHTFHIPVLGVGYSMDTPIKVAHLGIDSVISIVDDFVMEKMRQFYSEKFCLPFESVNNNTKNSRVKRITLYLNMVNDIVEKKVESFRLAARETYTQVREYLGLLPENATLLDDFNAWVKTKKNPSDIVAWIRENLPVGSIDVNIMTKVDKTNYYNGEALPYINNDAHAALRGFAESKLKSSVVFSAGMNPRLYGYIEQFEDFYPDAEGTLSKKIILKVSDYRSAEIQGKFLAKKGLWVSEYRIESGLNCGGHAFATEGYLLGPILEEFKNQRDTLIQSQHELFINALKAKNRPVPSHILPVRITAQGGVGTAEEHDFLLRYYRLDAIGWGTPFLLVPEATSVDSDTLQQLQNAGEGDLYRSDISPLGVPFNNLRNNSKDLEKDQATLRGTPGTSCPKKLLVSTTEFSTIPLCTASSKYLKQKIKAINNESGTPESKMIRIRKLTEKACLCMGLSESTLQSHGIGKEKSGRGVSICPGPNLAYFSRIMTLNDITGHIYGKTNMCNNTFRPNLFFKEIILYIEYLESKISEAGKIIATKQQGHLRAFAEHLENGIHYYLALFKRNNKLFAVKHKPNETVLLEFLQGIESIKNRINTMAE